VYSCSAHQSTANVLPRAKMLLHSTQERRHAVDALSSDMQRLQGQLEAARAEAAEGKQHAEELQRRLAKAHAAAASHPLPPHEVPTCKDSAAMSPTTSSTAHSLTYPEAMLALLTRPIIQSVRIT
jgi:outer membrane murein-binding lipoprotein Lpp